MRKNYKLSRKITKKNIKNKFKKSKNIKNKSKNIKKRIKNKKGGAVVDSEKKEAITDSYSKSELSQKVQNPRKMESIEQIIPVMNRLNDLMVKQNKTFKKLNKILGNYFTKK